MKITALARLAPSFLFFGAALAGCGRDRPLSSASSDDELALVPAQLELFRGQRFEIDVLVLGGEVAESVLGREGLELEVVPPALAAVGTDGAGAALVAGLGELIARFGNREARANLVVSDAELVSISVAPPSLTLASGTRANLRVTGQLSDGSELDLTASASGTNYASSNAEIATVGEDGQVIALSPGEAFLRVQQGGQSVQVPVAVLEGGLEVTRLRISPSPIVLGSGEETSFDVLGVRSDGTEVSVLGDPGLTVQIEGDAALLVGPGRVGGVRGGEGGLIAQLGLLDATADVVVSDDAAFFRLEVVPSTLVLQVGEIRPLQVLGVRRSGASVDVTSAPRTTYRSTDTTTVRVSPSGGVTGLAPTSDPVAVVIENGGLEARVEVIVRRDGRVLQRLEATPERLDFAPRQPLAQLRVTGSYSDGTREDVTNRATFTSANSGVVTTGPGGVVIPRGPGDTTIQVALEGVQTLVPVSVAGPANLIGLSLVPPFIRVETDVAFIGVEVIAQFSDGSTRNVTFDPGTTLQVLDTSVAGWTGMAVVGVRAGTTTLRASFGGLSSISQVLVSDAPPPPLARIELIAPGSLGVMDGGPYQVLGFLADATRVDLTNAPGLRVVSSNPAIADVSAGRVIGLSPGRVTLTATVFGLSDTATVEVRAPTETLAGIAWRPPSLTLGVGQNTSARLIATFSTGRTADISADPSVSLNVSGGIGAIPVGGVIQVFALNAGSAAIVATFRGVIARLTVNVTTTAARVTEVQVQAPANLDVGDVDRFSVVAIFSDGSRRDVTGDPGLGLAVSPAGVITAAGARLQALSAGQATLTATFSGISGAATIRVSTPPDPVVRVEFQPNALTVQIAQTQTTRLFAVRQSGTRTEITNDPGLSTTVTGPITVRTGASGGLDVTGTSAGTASVDARFNGLSATLTVTVQGSSPQVTFVFITLPNFQLDLGQTITFAVNARFADGTTRDVTGDPGVSLSVSDASILRLTPPDTLRALAVGQSDLQASFGGQSTRRPLEVIPRAVVSGLQWSPGQLAIGVNQTDSSRLVAARIGASFLDVTTSTEASYTTTGPITIAVNPTTSQLDVTATGNGAATVSATFRGLSTTLSVAAGLAPRVIGLVTSPASPIALGVNATVQINVTEQLSDGTTRTALGPTFQDISSANQGAPISVSASGLVTGRSPGQGRIVVRAAGFAASIFINVAAAPPTITTLSPNTLAVDEGPTTLVLTGANFVAGDRVFVNGSVVPSTFVSGSRITFTNAGPLFRRPGTAGVQVSGVNGNSSPATLRLGVAPDVTAISPSRILQSSTLQVSLTGAGLTGTSFSGAPLTFSNAAARAAGTAGTVDVTVPAMTPPGNVTVTVTNDFGTDTFSLEMVRPTTRLSPAAGSGVTLFGTNAFTSVDIPRFSAITTSGDEPVIILSAGDVTVEAGAAIVLVGEDGGDGDATGGAGGAAGGGGAGGGGGADGNGPAASGGAGTPAGRAAASSAGSGTAAGDGGGATGGGGASGGCAVGGGGGGRGGRGGGGGGDSGIGTGGAGGTAGDGSDFGGGTGGGGGSTCNLTDGGGGGGGGGGKLIIQVANGRTIRINGQIVANGGDGGPGQSSGGAGGGGGSGGLIELRAPGGSVIVQGFLRVEGGDGGDALFGDGGGGGSGGVILLEGTTINANNNRLLTGGGTGGGSTRQNAGQAGQPGQVLRNP